MLSPQDFPPFKLCESCKHLFVDSHLKDPESNHTIQYQMWYVRGGYRYVRLRREFEQAVMEGCTFCKAVALGDAKYKHPPSSETDIEDGSEDPSIIPDPRPAWFPPLDEEVVFKIKYDFINNLLYIDGRGGIDWTGGDLSWSLHTTASDPASDMVHSHAILTEFGVPETLDVAREWITECLASHRDCPANDPKDLPTRLVRVSPLGEPESAQLCYTLGQKGTYCALSYCWGDEQPFKTTWDRYNTYLEALPYGNLPQTIRDAFHVARSLGLQYIWIDSLCIVQDNEVDVGREMAKMMQIYLNTLFTISAANASSCNQGFLKQEFDTNEGPFFLPLRVDENTMGSILISKNGLSWPSAGTRQQPINDRAWTLQEALLTPRLLVFTNLNMIWKCRYGTKPEVTEPPGTYRDLRLSYRYDEHMKDPWWNALHFCGFTFASIERLYTPPSPHDEPPTDGSRFDVNLWAPAHGAWCSLVGDYTRRKLSLGTDKLPAISAIAEMFAPQVKGDYVAGLWRRYLVYDLMWHVSSWIHPKPCNSGSPSWSWAAIDGEVSFVGGNSVYASADILDCQVDLVVPEAPYGSVRGGKLVIRGWFKEVKLDKEWTMFDVSGHKLPNSTLWSDVDTAAPPEIPKVWGLTLGHGPLYEDKTSRQCHSLLLAAAPDQPGCYRRLGYFQSGVSRAPFWWEENCKREVVSII